MNKEMNVKKGFIPISIKEYVKLYLEANTETKENENDVFEGLRDALTDYKNNIKCECGNPIWVVGSAAAGNACFTCITGEAKPDDDYEIDEACE